MQVFLAIEMVPVLMLVMKVGIRNIEQELRSKPIRYDAAD